MKKKKKACKKCKILTEEEKCPLCSGPQLTDSWKGQVIILNPEESEIAKVMNIKQKGNYAIKI